MINGKLINIIIIMCNMKRSVDYRRTLLFWDRTLLNWVPGYQCFEGITLLWNLPSDAVSYPRT